MTVDDRRHYSNLILLCDECHSVIDNKSNEDKYPVTLLIEWKSSHTTLIQSKIFKTKPSLLSLAINAINAIADLEFELEGNGSDKQINAFKISDKIEFNSVKRNKPLIEEYSHFYGKINALYCELEDSGSFKKDKLLRNIRQIYVRVKGQYLAEVTDELQINADNIFEAVEEELLSLIDEKQPSSKEDIGFAIPIIMVDAFMRCEILEEPSK